MNKLFLSIVAAGALIASSAAALAAPITGSIGFGLGITPEDLSDNAVSLGAADHIDVIGDIAGVTVVEPGSVLASIFTPIASTVSYYDFDINPFTPVSPLWTGSGFSFSLLTMTIDSQSDSFLGLSGEGVLSGAGYDDTPYSWSFSADTSLGGVFSASSTNTAIVSEPSSIAFFGLGVAGLVAARKRKADKKTK